jgi:hypothetical protein
MMSVLKAYMASHQEIAKTLYHVIEPLLIAVICLGTAPGLVWVASNQFGI